MKTKLFHTETPITAASFDIRADYAAKYGADVNVQAQEHERQNELSTIHPYDYHGDMREIDKAEMVASWFHRNDTDMAGEPYINHCLRTASNVADWCAENEINEADMQTCIAVALMHDVVEDTPCTFADLQLMGFSPAVYHGVVAMTQGTYEASNGETNYEDLPNYWARVKANWHAHVVKVCGDIVDNNDEVRMERGNMPTARRLKLHNKYARALAFLGEPDPDAAPRKR